MLLQLKSRVFQVWVMVPPNINKHINNYIETGGAVQNTANKSLIFQFSRNSGGEILHIKFWISHCRTNFNIPCSAYWKVYKHWNSKYFPSFLFKTEWSGPSGPLWLKLLVRPLNLKAYDITYQADRVTVVLWPRQCFSAHVYTSLTSPLCASMARMTPAELCL